MLVRAGNDGEWLQLLPVGGVPSGGLRSLCGTDAANLLELDTPLPVAAFGPWPQGSLAGVDAVCLTPDGDIELLVGTWGENPRDTLWRLLDVAGTLRGTTLEVFTDHLTELDGETSVARWLQRRVGGDEARIEARLRDVLERGDFGFLLVTPDGAGDLAHPLQVVRRSSRTRVFEVEVLRAGDVQAIEGIEVPLDGPHETPAPAAASAPAAAAPAPMLSVVPEPEQSSEWDQAATAASPQPELVAVMPEPTPEPTPEPEAELEVEPGPEAVPAPPEAEQELEAEQAAEADLEPDAAVEPETFLDEPDADDLPVAPETPSDVDRFFAAVDRLDHRTSAHLRWLHDALLRLVDEAEYTTDGDRQFLTGWMHGAERLPLFLLDGNGLLQLVLASLPEHEQREFADEVAGMLPETSGSVLLKAGYADVDVPAHLDDQTLLEYMVDNLMEALPGGREAFGTLPVAEPEEQPEAEPEAEQAAAETDVAAPEATEDSDSEGGADFFDGMSTEHDPTEVAGTTLAELGADQSPSEPVAEEPAEPVVAEVVDAPHKSGTSRWLRRRGAA